jgi:hypothetical protein
VTPERQPDAAAVVARVEGAACWVAGVATKGSAAAGAAGLVLWWLAAGGRVTGWWHGTLLSALVLVACLAPAEWLMNVRFAMVELVELPETLRGVAVRRAGGLRGRAVTPARGVPAAVRSVRDAVRDYGDVTGSWGAVAQVVTPAFWFLTAAALAAVPVLAAVAVVWAAIRVLS